MSFDAELAIGARQVILDTETTGISTREGHRIVEIGCVEFVDRKPTGSTYHVYINPQKIMEQEVIDVHGIENEFLADKPLFHEIADEFFEYIKGAELIIHNAKFDIGFMDHEFALTRRGYPKMADVCQITDTLKIAKDEFGSPRTLDALAKFYRVEKLVDRTYHGALIDAQLLAYVYVEMTRKQGKFNLTHANSENASDENGVSDLLKYANQLKVIHASADELQEHQNRLQLIQEKGGSCQWLERGNE